MHTFPAYILISALPIIILFLSETYRKTDIVIVCSKTRWTFECSHYITISLKNLFLTTRHIESLHKKHQTKNSEPGPSVRLFNASEPDFSFTVNIKIVLTLSFIGLLSRKPWYISFQIKFVHVFQLMAFLKNDPSVF